MEPDLGKGLALPLPWQLTAGGQLGNAVPLRLAAGRSLLLGMAPEKVLAAPDLS